MPALKPDEIKEVKGKGFLINRGTTLFSGRIVAPGTVFMADDMEHITRIAKDFGNGKLVFTSRLAVEIPGIPYDRIQEAIDFAKEHNLRFGGTGAKIRPVTACKGTTCIYGNFDTQELAAEIHTKYYLGWNDVKLPHKFKIAVGGCPNSCMKPSINDFGIEGRRVPAYDGEQCRGCKSCAVEKACPVQAARLSNGKLQINAASCLSCGVCTGKCPFKAVAHDTKVQFQIYLGGTWGKQTRMGTPLPRLVEKDEILPILEKTMLWFQENAYEKERLGKAMDRIGADKITAAVLERV